MDPETGRSIVKSLERAVEVQPAGSVKDNILRNLDFFEEAYWHMERAEYRNVCTLPITSSLLSHVFVC